MRAALVLGTLTSVALIHGTARADLPENCLAPLNAGTIPADFVYGALPAASAKLHVLGKPDVDSCAKYTWISFTIANGPARILRPLPVTNVNSDAGDCVHSTIQWGAYGKNGANPWVYITGGQMFGKLVRGACTYDPTNLPGFDGGFAAVSLPAGSQFQYRLAVQHWQHDHSGEWCGGPETCGHDVDVLYGQSNTYSGVFVGGEWDTVYSPTPFDWEPYFTKGTCAPGWTQSGLSNYVSEPSAHRVLCRYVGLPKLPGDYVQTLSLPGNQRRANRSIGGSSDWSPGQYKLECGSNEYVSGSSMSTASGHPFRSVMCAQASSTAPLKTTGCYTRIFDTSNADSASDNEDWDYGYLKGECAPADYLAGVSVTPSNSRPYALLCCPR